MSDIEDIREEKRKKLERKAMQDQEEEAMKQQREEAEMQKEALLKQNLEEGARKRLNTVQMAKPEFGEQVEQQMLQLIQSGQIDHKITEQQMKEILEELNNKMSDNTDYNIKGAGLR
jgi:programmed cell death protein 5